MDRADAEPRDIPERLRITGLTMLPRPRSWRRASAYDVVSDRLELVELGGGSTLEIPLEGEPLLRGFGRWVEVDLPLELVPEVVGLDLNNPDAILGFVSRYGPMGARADWFGQFDVTTLTPGVHLLSPGPLPEVPAGTEFVSEFVQAASSIKALVRCTQALERERFSPMDLARDWPSGCVWEVPRNRGEARRLLIEAINSGLSTMRLGLAPVLREALTQLSALLARDLELSPALGSPTTLYGVCVLEFASALLEGRGYRACGNERCRRLFTLQEGRSRTGRHRPDIAKYCSKSCANQQAMRVYRRRKSLERIQS